MPILFGTFNRSTATSSEVELSQSLQTAFANFAKNPNSSPAPHWPPYEPEVSGNARTPTLAKIAYQGNVDFDNFVQPVQPDSAVSTRNTDTKSSCLFMNFSYINRMGRAVYGTFFWISALEKLATFAQRYSHRASRRHPPVGTQGRRSVLYFFAFIIYGQIYLFYLSFSRHPSELNHSALLLSPQRSLI